MTQSKNGGWKLGFVYFVFFAVAAIFLWLLGNHMDTLPTTQGLAILAPAAMKFIAVICGVASVPAFFVGSGTPV